MSREAAARAGAGLRERGDDVLGHLPVGCPRLADAARVRDAGTRPASWGRAPRAGSLASAALAGTPGSPQSRSGARQEVTNRRVVYPVWCWPPACQW